MGKDLVMKSSPYLIGVNCPQLSVWVQLIGVSSKQSHFAKIKSPKPHLQVKDSWGIETLTAGPCESLNVEA